MWKSKDTRVVDADGELVAVAESPALAAHIADVHNLDLSKRPGLLQMADLMDHERRIADLEVRMSLLDEIST